MSGVSLLDPHHRTRFQWKHRLHIFHTGHNWSQGRREATKTPLCIPALEYCHQIPSATPQSGYHGVMEPLWWHCRRAGLLAPERGIQPTGSTCALRWRKIGPKLGGERGLPPSRPSKYAGWTFRGSALVWALRNRLRVPSRRGNAFVVREGAQGCLCSRVLLLPHGVPPAPAPAMLHTKPCPRQRSLEGAHR